MEKLSLKSLNLKKELYEESCINQLRWTIRDHLRAEYLRSQKVLHKGSRTDLKKLSTLKGNARPVTNLMREVDNAIWLMEAIEWLVSSEYINHIYDGTRLAGEGRQLGEKWFAEFKDKLPYDKNEDIDRWAKKRKEYWSWCRKQDEKKRRKWRKRRKL